MLRAPSVWSQKGSDDFFGSGRNPAEALAFESRGGETGGCVQPVCDADFWRRLAQKARATAETMTVAAAKREMQVIASAYERLADHAERTAGRRAGRKVS
jgi:hypothetical protein